MDETEPRNLRIIAGYALWCINARLRASDAVRITTEPDLEPASVRLAGRGKGFLEVQGQITKTSQQKSKRRRFVPMAAHSWGITTDAWGPTWLRIRGERGRNARTDGTLMLGCGPDYSLVKTPG